MLNTDKAGQNITVTGATGHIGNVTCRELLRRGYAVRAMYRTSSKAISDLPVEYATGDILNLEDTVRATTGCNTVIHCAGCVSLDKAKRAEILSTNIIGTQNLLEAAIVNGTKRIVHVSSVHAVTELPHAEPYTESRPYKTANALAYDYSKARSEQILLEGASGKGIDVVILRPSAVVGPFDFKPSLMGQALMRFYHQKIPFLPPGGYDFVDVRDVAIAIAEAIDKGRPGEAYIVSGKYYNFSQLAMMIGQVTGKRMPTRVIPVHVLRGLLPLLTLYAGLTRTTPSVTRESLDVVCEGHPFMDHSKARRELNHIPRPLEESLKDFYTWQMENAVN